MSKGIIVALALGLGVAAVAHEGHESGAAGKDVTVTGEILDLACYMGHQAKGEKHAQCAKGCLTGGAPMGLLQANGNVVLLVNDHKAEQAYKDAQALGGETATVTGHQISRGGLTAVVVEKASKG